MVPSRHALAFEASTTGFLLVSALMFFAPARSASFQDSKTAQKSAAPPNPQELVRRMVQNEIKAAADDNTHWQFRKTDEKAGQTKTWEIVETKNGDVQRLIAIDGHPLTKTQQETEQARIRKYLTSPRQQAKRKEDSSNDFEKEQKLMEMLPNTLLYQYAGKQDGSIRLTFKPNPHFHASSREAAVFHHMTGELWISEGSTRLAQLRGKLSSRVNFGGGWLGHLNKGGTFDVKQEDVGDGHWDSTLLDTDLTGKALFFKTISVREKITEFDYHRVPDDLSLQQAAELLKRDGGEPASEARKTS